MFFVFFYSFLSTSGGGSSSQAGSQRVHSVKEEFLITTKHCTIDEIVDSPEVHFFNTYYNLLTFLLVSLYVNAF